MISLEKWMNLTPVQKLLKNVGDLGKFIFAKGPKSHCLRPHNVRSLIEAFQNIKFCQFYFYEMAFLSPSMKTISSFRATNL